MAARAAGARFRIAHVINTLDVGGAERLVVALARSQRRSGHTVQVQCVFRSGPLEAELAADGISVLAGHMTSRVGRARALAAAFWRFSPDVVHCHNVAATLLAAPIARLLGARAVISTIHGIDEHGSASLEGAKFWLAARACSYVVGVSGALSQVLSRGRFASRSRVVTILNGADAPSLPTFPPRPGGPVLLCVARLSRMKDHATLLRAIAAVRPSQPDLQLWLVGDGPERNALERLCQELALVDTVHFFGEQQDVGPWLARADLFVLSSAAEGTPLALMEALSAGLIPVVTAAGGVPEIMARSGVGFVVPIGDPAAMANAIGHAIEQRRSWPDWRQRARDAYERHFTIGRMCDDYEQLIVRSLARGKRVEAPSSQDAGVRA
jgi:glycosyltransferase involved in cell wall biosynthesis